MSTELADYYVKKFRKDIAKINFTEGSSITNPGDFFFNKQAWLTAVDSIESETTKAYFIDG